MSDLPEPLVPIGVDLRDYAFYPLDITRLFGSEFHAVADDAAWRAGLTLWLKSYHQVPAGSVPDDDVALARLAELGRDVRSWKRMRANALRGWTKCSDGRLHHKVVAEKALEGWIGKLGQRKASAAGVATRQKVTFDGSTFDRLIEEAAERLRLLNPNSTVLARLNRQLTGGQTNGRTDGATIGQTDGATDSQPSKGTVEVKEESSGSKEPSGEPRKRASRLPDGWSLPDEWRSWAFDRGYSHGVIDAESERMANWSKSSPAGKKLDWFAAWRNWISDKPKGAVQRSGPSNPPRTTVLSELVLGGFDE